MMDAITLDDALRLLDCPWARLMTWVYQRRIRVRCIDSENVIWLAREDVERIQADRSREGRPDASIGDSQEAVSS